MYVTFDELERRAYIAGLTPLADIAAAIDEFYDEGGYSVELHHGSPWVSPTLLRDIDAAGVPTPPPVEVQDEV